jgi:hypothetical protein
MDKLLVIGGINALSVYADHGGSALLQTRCRLDRTTFVPEQDPDTDNDQDKPDEHSGERTSYA